MSLTANILVIFGFFFIGGVFSAAEMSLVSLRESQVKALSRRGKRGKALQELLENPNRFLSSVQIGVTFAGFLSSALGSSTIGTEYVAPWLNRTFGLNQPLATTLSTIVLTIVISYFSIVLSELTAKRLAMQRPEEIALGLARFINGVAKLFRPFVWALGASTNVLVRLLGFDPKASREGVTEAELRSMVANSASLGVEERHIVDEVFDAGDSSLREVMVPRTEVDFLPGDMPAYEAMREVKGSPHSRYPVTDGSPDRIVGFLHVRDLMDLDPGDRSNPVRLLVRPVLQLPETVKVLRALTDMRRKHSHLAIVLDEYGGTAGIVTLEDLVEELIGDITDEYDIVTEGSRQHERVSDIEGLTTIEDYVDQTGYLLPEGPYDTVAGYFLAQFGRIPQVGDSITVILHPEGDDAYVEDPLDDGTPIVLTISEMDERRIAWLSMQVVGTASASTEEPAFHGATAVTRDENTLIQLQDIAAEQELIRDLERRDKQAAAKGQAWLEEVTRGATPTSGDRAGTDPKGQNAPR